MRFIITATLTYIPFTVIWFFWHNNLFPSVYYNIDFANPVNSINLQNIWAMNFANALLVYGFVYFYFRSVKTETKMGHVILWGVYYNISVIGFYSFLNMGMLKEWRFNVLFHDMIFAVIGGVVSGVLVHYLYKRFKVVRSDG